MKFWFYITTIVVLMGAWAVLVHAQDQWDIYTDKGWKGTIYVNPGSYYSSVSGWFLKPNGTQCVIETSPTQYFEGDLRGGNFFGDIDTNCGTWKVWKAKYAVPVVSGSAKSSRPFGYLFTGKVLR